MDDIRINDQSFDSVQFRRLSDEQCAKIHSASLEILERTGAMLYDQQAIDLLKRAGAFVSDDNRVRVPSALVEKAFTTVPKRVVLCNRYGQRVMQVEGHRCFYGPGSDLMNIIDHRTNERRKPVLDDVRQAMIVSDALPDIDYVMSSFLPSDVDQTIYDRYQMEAMLNYTTKPMLVVTPDFEGLELAVEMAEIVVGGAEALARNPLMACYINVTSGLIHNEEALQKLMYLAERRLPALYIPVTFGGMNAPVTMAGCLAVNNAGALLGLVVSQLTREGAPFIMPAFGTAILNMRTLAGGVPDTWGIEAELAHYYGLPMFGIAGTSAKVVDQQAVMETAISMQRATLSGANIIHDLGYMEGGLTGSLALFVIAHEMIGYFRHSMRAVEVSDETLALDLIDAIGPLGSFLDSPHTRKHYRQYWYPRTPELVERQKYAGWVAQGSTTLLERATQRVDEILATHEPDPLPDDMVQAIRAIVERAEAGLRH
jgi:trimethylamine--corrinoid protein Co-methyltransferase